MTPADERELDWWRHFASKFQTANVPRVESPLYGHRLVLMVETPHGLTRWEDRNKRRSAGTGPVVPLSGERGP